MVELITVINDIHIPRIKAAYSVDGQLPTNAELQALLSLKLKRKIKNDVINYELNKAKNEALQEQDPFNI